MVLRILNITVTNTVNVISLFIFHQKFDRGLMTFQILYYVIQCLNIHNVNIIRIYKCSLQQNTYARNNDSI